MTDDTRQCNGGPHGKAWCGKPATCVPRDESGLEWFACDLHTEGCGTPDRPGTRCLSTSEWRQAALGLVQN